eukprot:TRINITY_DN11363_c0_g1_i2.p1 TRINITY_DN11363_c0_g1~~TRINITY_DN11363_c0_g1_i2.p1  ORF type:complete len:136 (+),score=18.31 TRINITY_DN11363_c0_g1_i2:7-414(+)
MNLRDDRETEVPIGDVSFAINDYSSRGIHSSLCLLNRKYSGDLSFRPRKSILKTKSSTYIDEEQPNTTVMSDEKTSRRDRFGNEIGFGRKNHHISFSENLVEVNEVENHKDIYRQQELDYHVKPEGNENCVCILI